VPAQASESPACSTAYLMDLHGVHAGVERLDRVVEPA
jgi:hypothetical protein